MKQRGPRMCIRAAGIALGLGLFAVSLKSGDLPLGFQRLGLLQFSEFRAILRISGLGLVVAFTIGDLIDRSVRKILGSIDGWLLQSERRSTAALILLIAAYTITYSGVTFYRHYSFNSTGFDLAILDQAIWNTAQGRPFARSIYGIESQLGAHIRPYIALLSLPYIVFPSPYILLAFQSLVLALTAWPLYRLSKRRLNSPAMGLVIAFCGLAYPPLGFLNRFDFHPEVVAVPLLAAAYERLDASDLKGTLILAGLALFAKEDIGVTVAALGLLIALRYKRWFLGSLSAVVSLTYSAVALLVIIPFFRGEPSHALSRYAWLGDTVGEMLLTMFSRPGFVLGNVIEARRITTFLQLLAPLAFLPILGWSALIVAVPALTYNYLAQHFCQPTIYCHYMAPVIPFILISSVLGLSILTSSLWGRRVLGWMTNQSDHPEQGIGIGISIIVLATFASWTYQSPVADNSFASPAFRVQSNSSAIREGLGYVPDDVDVATTNAYAPHLSHRNELEILMYGRIFDDEAELFFLNLRDLRWTMSCADYRECLEQAADSGFGVTFYKDGVVVVRKHAGNHGRLRDLLSDWPGCE